MAEAQDLRSGTHSNARFEKSNQETFPSAIHNCENQSNNTSNSKTKWQPIEIEIIGVKYRSPLPITLPQRRKSRWLKLPQCVRAGTFSKWFVVWCTMLLRFNVIAEFRSLAWREYLPCGTLWCGWIFHQVYSFFVTVLAKLSWQLCHSGGNVERQMNSLLGTRNVKHLRRDLVEWHMVTAVWKKANPLLMRLK